jgi:hypothetical protein
VAEEVDAPIIGHFERVLLTRVSTLPNSQGAMTGFKRGFDGLMIVESARNRTVKHDLKQSAPEFTAETHRAIDL